MELVLTFLLLAGAVALAVLIALNLGTAIMLVLAVAALGVAGLILTSFADLAQGAVEKVDALLLRRRSPEEKARLVRRSRRFVAGFYIVMAILALIGVIAEAAGS